MKTKFVLLLALLINFGYAQEIYTYKNGKIFENGKKINTEYIKTAFDHKKEIANMYSAGKTKQTVGNVLFYGGIATVAIKHLTMLNIHDGNNINVSTNNTMYFVGFGIIATSIPIKIGYPKKIKAAKDLMNQEIKSQKTTESFNVIYNQNGLGVTMQF